MPRKTKPSLSKSTEPSLGENIVFLTSGGPLYWIIANALNAEFGPIVIVQEEVEPKAIFLKRRLKKLGPFQLAGQVAFGVLAKFVYKLSRKARATLISSTNADTNQPQNCRHLMVPDVNSSECQ